MLLKLDLTSLSSEILLILLACATIGLNALRSWLWEMVKDKNKLFIMKARSNAAIAGILSELRWKMKANRACLYEFSNTKQSVTGIGFQYINLTTESTDLNTAKISSHFKEEHVANYPVFIARISEPQVEYILYNVTDVNIHPEIKAMMVLYGLRSLLVFKLNPQIVHGLIGIHWSHDYYRADEIEVNVNKLEEDDLFALREAARQIMKLKTKPKWYEIVKFKP